jgi:hypothetical protein
MPPYNTSLLQVLGTNPTHIYTITPPRTSNTHRSSFNTRPPQHNHSNTRHWKYHQRVSWPKYDKATIRNPLLRSNPPMATPTTTNNEHTRTTHFRFPTPHPLLRKWVKEVWGNMESTPARVHTHTSPNFSPHVRPQPTRSHHTKEQQAISQKHKYRKAPTPYKASSHKGYVLLLAYFKPMFYIYLFWKQNITSIIAAKLFLQLEPRIHAFYGYCFK